MRYLAIALAILASLPASADSRFHIVIAPRPGLEPGKGLCDIRLEIDNEAEVTIRRDLLLIHTVSGQEARDDGSECNVPLPAGEMPKFELQPLDSRGEIRILQRPSARNDFAVVLPIVDSATGFGRYHFRLSWDASAAASAIDTTPPSRKTNEPDRPAGPPGFVWNNAVDYHGHGSGESVLNEHTTQKVGDMRVDIDLGGKIVVAFAPDPPRGPHGVARRPLVFSGSVMSREGSSIRASMTTEDQRLRGTMTLSVDENRKVNSLSMSATDGQDHLRLTWDRR